MIPIKVRIKRRRRNNKKSNKFSDNKDANTFIPDVMKVDAEKKRQLMRVRRMSGRKYNVGIQSDYLYAEGI